MLPGRRENDERRRMVEAVAKGGSIKKLSKPSKKDSAATRKQIKDIQEDSKTLANQDPKKYAAKDASGQASIWDDNKPNFEATREADTWPSKDSPTGKPGMAEYRKAPPPPPSKNPW